MDSGDGVAGMGVCVGGCSVGLGDAVGLSVGAATVADGVSDGAGVGNFGVGLLVGVGTIVVAANGAGLASLVRRKIIIPTPNTRTIPHIPITKENNFLFAADCRLRVCCIVLCQEWYGVFVVGRGRTFIRCYKPSIRV